MIGSSRRSCYLDKTHPDRRGVIGFNIRAKFRIGPAEPSITDTNVYPVPMPANRVNSPISLGGTRKNNIGVPRKVVQTTPAVLLQPNLVRKRAGEIHAGGLLPA